MDKCCECAKLDETCCGQTEVGVTSGDIARISAFTGRNDFYHLQPISEEKKFTYENPWNVPKGSEIYVKYFFDQELDFRQSSIYPDRARSETAH